MPLVITHIEELSIWNSSICRIVQAAEYFRLLSNSQPKHSGVVRKTRGVPRSNFSRLVVNFSRVLLLCLRGLLE